MVNNLSSSGSRNPSSLILRILSRSRVSFLVGTKSGGFGERRGSDKSGSSGNWRITRASSGNIAGTGRIRWFTGRYFRRPVAKE